MKIEAIKKIAVIGAGDMGNGIAQLGVMAGYQVAMRDVEERFVERGMTTIKKSLEKLVEKGKLSPAERDAALGRLAPQINLAAAVREADFVIEAVPEIMELKKQVFGDLDRLTPPQAILATNTSNMSISEIAAVTKRPALVLGMHFFNPAVLMKLVEVIKGEKTAAESAQTALDLALKMNKVPVLVKKDSPGFIYNRVNAPTGLFLSKITEEGHPTPEEFDAAMKAVMPMTPFELVDYVGIDVSYHSLSYFAQVLSPEYAPSALFKEKVQAGNLGKKTGRGFFDWSQGRPVIDPAKATAEYDVLHLIALQVNEATKLLDEGVVDDPKVIDLAMANGGGAGIGPFTLAQSIGYEKLVAKCEELAARFRLQVFKPTATMRQGNIVV